MVLKTTLSNNVSIKRTFNVDSFGICVFLQTSVQLWGSAALNSIGRLRDNASNVETWLIDMCLLLISNRKCLQNK